MLLNRKYGSRLECLYYILKSVYEKFGTRNEFALKDFKYNSEDDKNVHTYCKRLKTIIGGRKCCPYLNNPLDTSKCYATQSVDSDSTKSKAVSDIGGSLEALGFITRYGKKYKISELGESWIRSEFESAAWENIALKGVLSYGAVVGFLFKLKDKPDIFDYSGTYLGYPHTEETAQYIDENHQTLTINLSTDSQRDSNTRTVSKIINWCVTVGLIEPQGISSADSPLSHIRYRDFINSDELTVRRFKKTNTFKHLFDNKFHVENPLSYSRLHKDVKAMRENGGETLRRITMQHTEKILNRRFVFIFVLNALSENNDNLNFERLITAMKLHKEYFFVEGNDPQQIMESECEISEIAGIPFEMDGFTLIPKTTINEHILTEDAPASIISLAKQIVREVSQ